VPVFDAIAADRSRPHASIRAPTFRRAVPSRGQARSVRESSGAAGTVRESLRDLVVSARADVGCEAGRGGGVGSRTRADGVADGVRVRSFHPISGGMRTALLVIVLEQVARERISPRTPPRSASRADLSAPCRPRRRATMPASPTRGRPRQRRPVACRLHEVSTTNADPVDVRYRSVSGRTPRSRYPVTVARRA
jgi:hypothetical protein